MHLHILGVCGTFMSGLALLAKECGFSVTGSDLNIYPPMSLQLEQAGIPLYEGYEALPNIPIDQIIVGNVIKRGHGIIEEVLKRNIPYESGPGWLYREVLKTRQVFAVAGTHGKTTTTSLLTWILECAGLNPGFLIGGIPENFGVSSRRGSGLPFVIEADEYDSAFFDKRSKFIHYRPNTLILNNLEYDHADIFPDLAAIKQQFHHLVRTVPGNGLLVENKDDEEIAAMLAMGAWTPRVSFGKQGDFRAILEHKDGSQFQVFRNEIKLGVVQWSLLGLHNVKNALAAIAAAMHLNINPEIVIKALSTFKNVKRRLEIKGVVNEVVIYDDFAHHPTAIATTLQGLRARIGQSRLIAVLEFGSYTMRQGVHQDKISEALLHADKILCKMPSVDWGIKKILAECQKPALVLDDIDQLVTHLVNEVKRGDHVVIMSNSGFGNIHQKLLHELKQSIN